MARAVRTGARPPCARETSQQHRTRHILGAIARSRESAPDRADGAKADGRTDAAPHRHGPLEPSGIGGATALRVYAPRQVRRASGSPKSGPVARETSRPHQARHARGAIARSRGEDGRTDAAPHRHRPLESDPEIGGATALRVLRRGRSGERARVRNPDLLHARPHDSTKHDTRVVLSRVLARKDGRTDAAPHRHRPLEPSGIGGATALRVSAARQVRRACESPKSGPGERETSRQHQARRQCGAITRSRPEGRADGCCAPDSADRSAHDGRGGLEASEHFLADRAEEEARQRAAAV